MPEETLKNPRVPAVTASYYRQFGARPDLAVPAKGFGGWASASLPLNLDATALVVMHVWEVPDASVSPGWHSAAEFLGRAATITKDTLGPLVAAARDAHLRVVHVVAAPGTYRDSEGGVIEVAGTPTAGVVDVDEVHDALSRFHRENAHPGRENAAEVAERLRQPRIASALVPHPQETVVYRSEDLIDFLRREGINHLLYTGFAINACLQHSPGGMVDLRRSGAICSVVVDAVTAVENAETATEEIAKAVATWQVAVFGGFAYRSSDLRTALAG